MPVRTENYDYMKTLTDVTVEGYEGYLPKMTDYHMHGYYELSLIVSGNVKVLLPDTADSGRGARLVLMKPMTPHFIVCDPSELYRRKNILFRHEFAADLLHELSDSTCIFGKNGRILRLDDEKCREFLGIVDKISEETNAFRKKMLLMFFLSLVSDEIGKAGSTVSDAPPSYVTDALSYIGEHYREKITAETLAWKLGVGRTTLMTGIRRYTGDTLNGYILGCRLRNAQNMLRGGKSEQTIAEECGFGSACNMIRAFKRRFGKTPREMK